MTVLSQDFDVNGHGISHLLVGKCRELQMSGNPAWKQLASSGLHRRWLCLCWTAGIQ